MLQGKHSSPQCRFHTSRILLLATPRHGSPGLRPGRKHAADTSGQSPRTLMTDSGQSWRQPGSEPERHTRKAKAAYQSRQSASLSNFGLGHENMPFRPRFRHLASCQPWHTAQEGSQILILTPFSHASALCHSIMTALFSSGASKRLFSAPTALIIKRFSGILYLFFNKSYT